MLPKVDDWRKRIAAVTLATIVGWGAMAGVAAHDVPDRVTIRAFVKPEGERIHLLVRVPLILLLNLDLPKRGPGYLDLVHVQGALEVAAGVVSEEIVLFEGDRQLANAKTVARISLPSDPSFSSYAEALTHVQGPPLSPDTSVFWNQGFLDAHIEYPVRSPQADFSLLVLAAPGLGRSLETVVEFLPPQGPPRAYHLVGEMGRVSLDPRWHQAAWTFVKSGFKHILEGIDHLLFLLCLIVPLRRFRSLVIVVTSFTIAHSLTLLASAYGLVPVGQWFPPLVETLIAFSILYMAIENVFQVNLSRRWLITFGFGLVHGFGFSFALRESLQFAGSHLLLSLLSFNIGVELGQLLVVAVAAPAVALFFRHLMAERSGTILVSVLVAHTAWHWMIDRGGALGRQGILPLDGAPVVVLVGGVVLLLSAGSGLWFLAKRWQGQRLATDGSGWGLLSTLKNSILNL